MLDRRRYSTLPRFRIALFLNRRGEPAIDFDSAATQTPCLMKVAPLRDGIGATSAILFLLRPLHAPAELDLALCGKGTLFVAAQVR